MKHQLPLISIVMPTYNGLSHLKICLKSLNDVDYPHFETIIVDNNSSDGSAEFIKKNYPKVKLLLKKTNYGYAKGNDIGFASAKGMYIVFLSNDTRVTKNFLTEIVKVFKGDNQIGAVQSKILLLDTPEKLDSVGTFFTDTGFLYHYGILKRNGPKYSKQIEVFSAKGACMAFRRDILQTIAVDGEIFDSRFFAYFEETDMCHRAWLAGYKIVYAPKSVIYHKMGGTSSGFDNSFIQFHSFKNRINSYIKNLELFNLLKLLSVHTVLCELIAFAYALRGNVAMFAAVQKALWWNVQNLRTTLKKRNYIQSVIRKVSDKEIFSHVKKNPKMAYYKYLYIYRGLEYFEDEP